MSSIVRYGNMYEYPLDKDILMWDFGMNYGACKNCRGYSVPTT